MKPLIPFHNPAALRLIQWSLPFLLMTLLFTAGCATTQDSDLPWNVPQSWEGSPTLPGMND